MPRSSEAGHQRDGSAAYASSADPVGGFEPQRARMCMAVHGIHMIHMIHMTCEGLAMSALPPLSEHYPQNTAKEA
jgi:hypothetical protein